MDNKYEIDDLVRSYRMSLDSDPEYSGPAEDLFKSQKAKIKKKLKALEIIINKPQYELCLMQFGAITTYAEYEEEVDTWLSNFGIKKYTQEEFDLLKEVLENVK